MKKKKFNLLLNIATLCLCVAAIAFGVYSAKNASLNVSGTVGFTAHNVKAKVEAWISGFAETADGAPVTGKEQITADGGLLLDGADASFNLGATKGSSDTVTRYFSDLGTSGNPEDIIVEIKITNMTTAFNVLASVDFANSKATTDALKDKIKVDCDRSAAVLGTTEGTTEATFTFRISLLPNADGSYGDDSLTSPDTSNIQIKMNLGKTDLTQTQTKSDGVAVKEFTTAEKEAIKTGLGDVGVWEKYSYSDTILCYAERFPYYVEMGEYNSTRLRWLIVGTSADDGTITTLSEKDRTALSKGLMLNKTYVMLSEKVLLTDTDQSMPFQNKYTNSGDYLNDYGYSAPDYATSNIRQYLIGNTVKNGAKSENGKFIARGTDVNLMTKYNINNDPMYAKIQARNLASLYNESAISGETKDMLTVPTSKDGYTAVDFTGDTADKLWLLSQTEMEEIFKADYITGSRENYSCPLYMSSRTSVLTASSAAAWWLRSPGSYDAGIVRGVETLGYLNSNNPFNTDSGVRAAFLF